MTTEVWRPIPGTRGYEASSEGRVRSPKQVLKRSDNGIGYQIVSIVFADGRKHSVTVHRLVASAFHGPRPEGYDIAHLDHDKTNNCPSNLAYQTRAQNIADSPKSGLFYPWADLEVGQSFDVRPHKNRQAINKMARDMSSRHQRGFVVERDGDHTTVARRPMLGAMTCSATAEIGVAA